MQEVDQRIREMLQTYERALNASSTEQVMPLYAPDGVFMAQNSPSAVGTEAVREAYDKVFAAITLHVSFEVVEVRQTGEDWAFARTNSAGTTTVNATGEQVAEANQELFVLQRIQGAWKIARYCFSTTNPARA